MDKASHQVITLGQFGPQAQAYLDSPVHSQGADLEALAARVGARSWARALDLGCGAGHVAFRLAPLAGEVVACDPAGPMLAVVAAEAARRGLGNLVIREGAAEGLPFEDGSFDLVVSRYSAHHWSGFREGLAEARRVLRPGGLAAFMDVVSPDPPLLDTWLQAVELLRDPSHVRDHALAEWRQALAEAGFRPGGSVSYRVRMAFPAWITRMHTPAVHVDAIRSLQALAAEEVASHFDLEPDGSFTLDTMLIWAE